MDTADAVVIGSGPNGLVAAILLASAGWDVTVLERAAVPGGAVRSEELTKPGYIHDTFSAFYGLLHSTPVFTDLGLDERVAWANAPTPVAAVLDRDTAAFIERDVESTAKGLALHDPLDGEAWSELAAWWEKIGRRFFAMTLAPVGAVRPTLRFGLAVGPRRLLTTIRDVLGPVDGFSAARFRTDAARALLASGVSHSDMSIEDAGSTPAALILAMLGQFHGFPFPVGGAGKITDALVALLEEHGGRLHCGDAVERVVVERGRARAVVTAAGRTINVRHAVLADTGVVALTRAIVGEEHFPAKWLDGIKRFRYGTGIFKVDLALDGITPWAVDGLQRTGVVHTTGTMNDMARANFEARHGLLPASPMLVIGQQSVGDPSRAPRGGHTLWVETHVPALPTGDGAGQITSVDGWASARKPFYDRVIAQIESLAPGFRDRIVGWSINTPQDLEAMNPNLVGGDIGGGSSALDQQLVFRPVPGWFRYRTPVKGLYLCSASAHPGGGVHGMGGRNAARRVLRDAWKPRGVLKTAGGGRRAPTRD